MDKFKKGITEILNIIGYSEDKETFINNFVEISLNMVLNNLILTISEEKQIEFRQRISLVDQGNQIKIFNEYFTQEKVEVEIQKVFSANLADYLKEILPLLSVEQKDEVGEYLKLNFN